MFLQNSVSYLGHKVDANATEDKLEAIVKAPPPQNISQLKAFLGMLNYYGKFIGNLATVIHPRNRLLHRNTVWNWTTQCNEAFQTAKNLLKDSSVLAHYNSDLPIRLAADTSCYGIGANISHSMPDGSEKPVMCASHTLTKSEQNYSQLEKEALSLIYGVKKFHKFLYGTKFVLITDHKPLLTILGPKTGVPTLAAARLQRWSLILSA